MWKPCLPIAVVLAWCVLGGGHLAVAAPGDAAVATESQDGDDVKNSSAFAILGELHASNAREIKRGLTAEREGQTKEVRRLGARLARDHRAIEKQVTAFCQKEGIDLADVGEDEEKVADSISGSDFDVQFARIIVADRARDIASVSRARAMSDDDGLDKLLDHVLPVLHEHEKVARKILQERGEDAGAVGNP
jgi:predicted outer membrane protein